MSFLSRVASGGEDGTTPQKKPADQSNPLLAKAVPSNPLENADKQNSAREILEQEARFLPNPDLFRYQTGPAGAPVKTDAVGEWREYVFGQVERYRTLIDPDYSFCPHTFCDPAARLQDEQNREILRIMLKETGNFIRARAPWIETAVKYTRVEVTHNASEDLSFDSVKDPGPVDRSTVKPRKANDAFSFSGGLRTNYNYGVINVVAEAKARYNALVSFYRYDFTKHNNIVGLEYPFRADMVMQIRHESSYSTTSPDTFSVQDRTTMQMVSVLYQF